MSSERSATSPQKKQRPLVPFLRLAENPGEKAYLVGYRCRTCGATYLGKRVGCAKCTSTDPMEEIRLSDRGTLWTYSIVHQSVPGIQVPYVAAIVDLPEGVSVRCNMLDIDPDPNKIPFGMAVEMMTKKVREDAEGNEVIAFFFRPCKDEERRKGGDSQP